MLSHLWTRSTAVSILIFLFLLTATFTIIGILVKPLSLVTTIGLALIQIATATIALFIPPDRKKEARRKTEEAIIQYVLLQYATEDQRNTVIDRMRDLAPSAQYSAEEIADYLRSNNDGRRFAALASIQWQWPNNEDHAQMNFNFKIGELPQSKKPMTSYFPQLLDRLVDPLRTFEHNHTIEAMWGMSSGLDREQLHLLCKRARDYQPNYVRNDLSKYDMPGETSDKWGVFVDYLKKKDLCEERSQ